MARNRASMREGPLAELFKATEAAQKQAARPDAKVSKIRPVEEPVEETVESFDALLNGDLDDLPEQAFLNVGGADSARAKAAELLK